MTDTWELMFRLWRRNDSGEEEDVLIRWIDGLTHACARQRAYRRMRKWQAAEEALKRSIRAKEAARKRKLSRPSVVGSDGSVHEFFKPAKKRTDYRHMKSNGVVHVRGSGSKKTGVRDAMLQGVVLTGGEAVADTGRYGRG